MMFQRPEIKREAVQLLLSSGNTRFSSHEAACNAMGCDPITFETVESEQSIPMMKEAYKILHFNKSGSFVFNESHSFTCGILGCCKGCYKPFQYEYCESCFSSLTQG